MRRFVAARPLRTHRARESCHTGQRSPPECLLRARKVREWLPSGLRSVSDRTGDRKCESETFPVWINTVEKSGPTHEKAHANIVQYSQRRTLDLAARCDHMALWATFDAFPARIRLSARHDSTIPCVPMGPPIRCREVPRRRALKAALKFGTAPVLRARPYISSG